MIRYLILNYFFWLFFIFNFTSFLSFSNFVLRKSLSLSKLIFSFFKLEIIISCLSRFSFNVFNSFSLLSFCSFIIKAFSINVSNIKTFHSYQFPNFLNNTTNNSNKEKLNKLYKKIYEEKNNLKHIYVSQIINKNKSEKNESVSIKIKPKIINDINRNFITSEKRFMKYHGFNKRNKYKFNMNSYDKIKDKYYNVNSIKIIQLFLKKKLNIISKDVKTARNDCEIAKNDLISVYDSFNSQIQKKIDDVYSREDLYENLA